MKSLHISTVHNPSHLEAQNAVTMGKTRSKQTHMKTDVLNVQIHGDAAFSAQGIVYESLCLSKVPYYKIDGTVHLIVNNQIGYTTRPIHSRSSKYCSDIVKAFGVPIIHVNSESVEDVYRVMRFAVDYRQKFRKDILVDLVCYRRYGHNEVDEPEFTQPTMYKQIRSKQTTLPKVYFDKLKNEGVLQATVYETIRKKAFDGWQSDFNMAKSIQNVTLTSYVDESRQGQKTTTDQWKGFKPSLFGQEQPTNVNLEKLREFAKASTFLPPNFTIHPTVQRSHIENRLKSIDKNQLNWATC